MSYDELELTPEEREALEMLPREMMPSRILEERTVKALKQRGLIGRRGPRLGVPQPWAGVAAVAAAVALFVSGIAVGQWMGAKQTANALATVYPDQAAQAAALVQSTGSAHTAALGRLVESMDPADPEAVELAREVALAAFWAAAAEIVRLAPDDPVAARILQETERAGPGRENVRSVVWF
jgi:hypothetical protein